jgi:hypothetical protein
MEKGGGMSDDDYDNYASGYSDGHGEGCEEMGSEIERLRAQLAAVKALHFPYDCTAAGREGHETCGQREWCYSCGEEQPWPCTTFQALRDA